MNKHDAHGVSPAPPPLAEVGIIGLVPDVWGSTWQPRQQVLTRLATYFNVVWVNPAREWRESLRLRKSPDEFIDFGDFSAPGFVVYDPEAWLPQFYRPGFLARFTARHRLLRAQRILRRRGSRKIILYLWRPDYGSALDLIGHDLSCFHIDDEYSFSDVEQPLDETEARLISRVDQVFIHSPELLRKKGHLNPHTLFVPNGVNYFAYATPRSEPEDLKPIPHPRIGYVGVIKKQIDFSLLTALVERHQDWSWVLIGPPGYLGDQATLVQKLAQMPHVHFLGNKPSQSLPAYTQHLDACLLCYAVNDYTNCIYPLKLHEYLACGRPVVGSPIRSLLDFAHIIKIARTHEEWSLALAESLAPDACTADRVEARRAVAAKHDWGALVRLIGRTMCHRLGPAYLERFEKICDLDPLVPFQSFEANAKQATQ